MFTYKPLDLSSTGFDYNLVVFGKGGPSEIDIMGLIP